MSVSIVVDLYYVQLFGFCFGASISFMRSVVEVVEGDGDKVSGNANNAEVFKDESKDVSEIHA